MPDSVMGQFEYIKEVFSDKTIHFMTEEGFDFVTEAPVPTIEEINREPNSMQKSFQVMNLKRYMKQSTIQAIFLSQNE